METINRVIFYTAFTNRFYIHTPTFPTRTEHVINNETIRNTQKILGNLMTDVIKIIFQKCFQFCFSCFVLLYPIQSVDPT